jgi:hypothetical protein
MSLVKLPTAHDGKPNVYGGSLAAWVPYPHLAALWGCTPINAYTETWRIVTVTQFKWKRGCNKRKGQRERLRLDRFDMTFSFSDIEMTAEWRRYLSCLSVCHWRYYGPCTIMHEFSDSSWRVLAVGRAECFPSLPDIRSKITNMTQLSSPKWVLESAAYSRTNARIQISSSVLLFNLSTPKFSI